MQKARGEEVKRAMPQRNKRLDARGKVVLAVFNLFNFFLLMARKGERRERAKAQRKAVTDSKTKKGKK